MAPSFDPQVDNYMLISKVGTEVARAHEPARTHFVAAQDVTELSYDDVSQKLKDFDKEPDAEDLTVTFIQPDGTAEVRLASEQSPATGPSTLNYSFEILNRAAN